MLAACKGPAKTSTTASAKKDSLATPAKAKSVYNVQLLDIYSKYLEGLDTLQMEETTTAAKKYTELFKDQDKNTCDSAFFIFDKYYGKLNSAIDDLHAKDTTLHYDSLLMDNVAHQHLSAQLSLYAKRLKTNGFKVLMTEGDTYIGQDLDFLEKWFSPIVSPVMKEYIARLNKDDKEGFQEDAGLTISIVQLASRTVWWEQFAAKYPDAITATLATNYWKGYLGTLLEGMDNTPVMDYENKTISDDYKTAYTYVQNKYPGTKTNNIIAPYFKLLLQKNKQKADDLIKQYQVKKIIY
ncbi:hypothetical protein SAMN05216524_1011055 [Mucilaginibacter sp. OK098]|nr:hypothetical protein SAMN05216524_1011055 [Mucilaginibacter sp. OK098]